MSAPDKKAQAKQEPQYTAQSGSVSVPGTQSVTGLQRYWYWFDDASATE